MANSLTYNRTKIHYAEGAAAATPDAAEVVTYAKADGLMYSKDDAGTETLMSGGPGGSALAVGTSALATVEGTIGWQSTTERVRIYDGQRERAVGAQGWTHIAMPVVFNPTLAFTTNQSMAANGGSIACPMMVSAHMLLERCVIKNRDTSLARSWEWRLYQQYLNNGNGGENTLAEVAGANGSESFTASAVSSRVAVATSAPVYLAPGVYWLVVRNTHASNAFNTAITATGAEFTPVAWQSKTLGSALGSTLDFVAATWTTNSAIVAFRLDGRVFGMTTQL